MLKNIFYLGNSVTIKEKLYQIRKPSERNTMRYHISLAIAVFLFGVLLGWLAKELDNTLVIGEIGTQLGLWIFTVTMISVYSRCAGLAALHTFLFLAAMLTAYYLHTVYINGFFPKHYIIVWTGFALLSPVYGWTVWFAKGEGWAAALCAAVPISLLAAEGYAFFYTFRASLLFDIVAAILLFLLLPKSAKQKLYTLGIAIVLVILFRSINILSLLFGGL